MISTDELKQVGRYLLKEKLGEGAMGVVYKAHDPNLGIDVAIKILRIELAEDSSYVERFLQEAKVIARLTHPNIVHVYNMDTDHGSFYIAMNFLEGKPLNYFMRENRPKLSQIIDIAAQIAEALHFAHKNKIIHRDIKPSNIIVSDDGLVTLTDFGVARFEDTVFAVRTMAGDQIGTPLYMAPEQLEATDIDGRTDLYALGIVLYEMTTRERPFQSFNRTIRPKPPSTLNPAICQDLSDLIMKCLEYNPDKRFKTGKELARALRSIDLLGSKKKNLLPYIFATGTLALCLITAITVYKFYEPKKAPTPQPPPPALLTDGRLTIASIPPGANIIIDGEIKGNTSESFTLPVGLHQIRLWLDHHYEGKVTVQVHEGETSLRYRLLSMDKEVW